MFHNPNRVVREYTYPDGKTLTRRFSDQSEDDQWFRLSGIDQIGVATAVELVKSGILKERYLELYRTQATFYRQRYRLATPQAEPFPEHEDFGDLWLP